MKPYYEDSLVTIYHADNLEILPNLQPVGCVLTDPPYGVDYKGRWNSEWAEIQNDKGTAWIAPVFKSIYAIMRNDSFCISFYGWPHADAFVSAWKECEFRLLSHLVFIKNQIGLGYFSRGQHEQAYLLAKGKPAQPETAISDVYHWERVRDPIHPTEKPVGALVQVLKQYGQTGGRSRSIYGERLYACRCEEFGIKGYWNRN